MSFFLGFTDELVKIAKIRLIKRIPKHIKDKIARTAEAAKKTKKSFEEARGRNYWTPLLGPGGSTYLPRTARGTIRRKALKK